MSIITKQRLRTRTALRFVIATSIATTALIVAALVFISGLSNPLTGYSYDRMQFISAGVFQKPQTAFRGSINQPVLHVVITATGQSHGLAVQSISFSAGGTSTPIPAQIENARLFFTGGDEEFNTRIQCGTTRIKITAGEFTMAANQPLNEGLNHFWLAFDIMPTATPNARIDAECNFIQIEANKHLPLTAAPAGSLSIDGSTPFFSTGNKESGQPGAWNSRRDGSGILPGKQNEKNVLFIQSGHKMECNQHAAFHALYIEKGGMLRVNAAIEADKIIIDEEGVLRHDLRSAHRIGTLEMKNGSLLIHNHVGGLMGLRRRLARRSTVCFYEMPEKSTHGKTSWGNVIIFVRSMRAADLLGIFEDIKGDFEIRKTGSGGYVYYSKSASVAVGGSLVISGGTFRGANGGVLSLNVRTALVMKDGYLTDATGPAGRTNLTIGGDVILHGGLFHFNKGIPGKSVIRLAGSTHPKATWTVGPCDVLLGNTVIAKGKEVYLDGGKLGDVVKGCSVRVLGGAALYCGRYPVTGPGSFVLDDHSTLGIGSINGIHSDANEGNILTAIRRFSSEATYIYHTASSPQQTGIFNTVPAANSVKTVILQKDNPADVVMVSASLSVQSGPLLRMGTLNENQFRIRPYARQHSVQN